ncbi:MAG: tetratricopeptide repeat protein [Lachnospiraceae bacterium]|nr:tetratricopeptide repeat protein [Candidatus Equihabitans merdae]
MKKSRILLLALILVLVLSGCRRRDGHDLFEAGAEAMEAGKYEEAQDYFSQAVENGMYLAEAYRGLGLSYMSQAKYADACIAFERSLLNADAKDAAFVRDVNLYLAHCRTLYSEEDKALEIYSSMLAKEPDGELYFLRGKTYSDMGEDEKAAADFNAAVAISDDFKLYINIYQIYNAQHKDADGADYLEMALEKAESKSDAYYEKGLVYYYLQNYNEARNQLLQAVNKNSGDQEAMLLLGRVYLAQQDAASARAMFQEHLGDDKLKAAAFNGLALCDMSEGSYDTALAYVERGLQINDLKSRQALLYNEVIIYEYKSEWKTAASKAAAYVTQYPSDVNMLRENVFLNSR